MDSSLSQIYSEAKKPSRGRTTTKLLLCSSASASFCKSSQLNGTWAVNPVQRAFQTESSGCRLISAFDWRDCLSDRRGTFSTWLLTQRWHHDPSASWSSSADRKFVCLLPVLLNLSGSRLFPSIMRSVWFPGLRGGVRPVTKIKHC